MIDPPATESLSETELEILRLLATGATNREIARTRGISEATVKKHVTNINVKLGTGNRTEAVRRALELGLVTVKTPDSEGANADAAAAHRATTRALSEELERLRRRTRHLSRWLAITGVVALAVVLGLGWAWLRGIRPPVAANPSPSPAPTSLVTPVPRFWLPGVNLPSPRTGLALVAEPGPAGAVLAIGGQGETGVLTETLRYDPHTLVWQPRAAKPTGVRDVGAVAVQGKVVVPGGCGADGRATDVTEIYDLNADTWSTGPRLPRPVCGYALVETDGRVYLFGGRDGAQGAPQRWVWSYQLGDSAWSEAPEDMPLARSDAAAVVVSKDEIHLLGGRDGSGLQSNHWLFRPFSAADSWATEGGPVLPEGRAGLGAAFSPAQGRIYVTGGGWDGDVEPWALALDQGLWQAAPDLRLTAAQRGAPLVTISTRDGQWLATAGGEIDGRLLDQYNLLELVRYRNIYLPLR